MVIAGRRVSSVGVVMVASIGINLFFAGSILSSYARMPQRPHAPRFERVIEEIAGSLPADDAALFRRSFARKRPELDDLEGKAEAMENRMRDVIRQDPVDPVLVRATVAEAQHQQQAFMSLMFNTMVDASLDMSHQGREALSDWHRHHP